MSGLWTKVMCMLSSEDSTVRKLDKDLKALKVDTSCQTNTARRHKAESIVKRAVKALAKSDVNAFKLAATTGSGSFVELMKVVIANGFGERMLLRETIKVGNVENDTKEISRGNDDEQTYYEITYKEDSQTKAKDCLPIEDLSAVSIQ